ncbi:MAG: MBL fold metallo-hydrolase [Bacteroidota bacterium]
MNRRNFFASAGILTGASVLSWNRLMAAPWMADYKMKLLRKNVGVFMERGGTIAWRIAEDGLVVVDTQFPDQSKHLIEEIRKQSDRKIDLLINTHHHGDHSSGNIAFKDMVGKVVAHENSKANQERVAVERGREAGQLYPDTTFTESWSESVGTENMRLHYLGAGHTNGDSLVHFEDANIVHMGDLLFNRRYPYIDRSSGADIKNWISLLRKAQGMFDQDTIFVFGHAFDPEKITGTKDDLAAKATFLEQLLDFVGKEIKAGKSKEEIEAATEIPGNTEWQGRGIKRGLTAAYEELIEG